MTNDIVTEVCHMCGGGPAAHEPTCDWVVKNGAKAREIETPMDEEEDRSYIPPVPDFIVPQLPEIPTVPGVPLPPMETTDDTREDGFGLTTDTVTFSETGGAKDNRHKIDVDQLPVGPLLAIAEVATYGGRKYQPWNWRRGLSYQKQIGSIQRHLLAFTDGEDIDPESGFHHLAHAGTQIMYLLEFELAGTGTDDRWPYNEMNPDRVEKE